MRLFFVLAAVAAIFEMAKIVIVAIVAIYIVERALTLTDRGLRIYKDNPRPFPGRPRFGPR